MFHVVKYREFKRVPKFKDILMQIIEKKKKEMQAARKKQNNMLSGNLNDPESQCSED
jgi:flagellar hook-basal body complex protein FliE